MENAAEAAVVEGVNVYGVRHLADVVAMMARPSDYAPSASGSGAPNAEPDQSALDFRDVRGQTTRETRVVGGSGWRPQRSDDRAAGLGQNYAGEALRRHPAFAQF